MILQAENKPNYIFSDESGIHRVYLTKAIGAPSQYTELFDLLVSAQPGEQIHFFINSPGGRVDTTCQLTSLMESCLAETYAHILGQAASAASVIPMYVDNLSVSPTSFMMIHNYSSGAYGKGDDLILSVTEQDKWVKNLFNEAYEDFLSPEEIAEVFRNQDIYLFPEQILERWEKVLKMRQHLADVAEAEELKKDRDEAKRLLKTELRNEIIQEYLDEQNSIKPVSQVEAVTDGSPAETGKTSKRKKPKSAD